MLHITLFPASCAILIRSPALCFDSFTLWATGDTPPILQPLQKRFSVTQNDLNQKTLIKPLWILNLYIPREYCLVYWAVCFLWSSTLKNCKKKKKINRNLRQAFRHPFLRPSTFFEMILLHNLSFMSVMLCGKHCFGLLKNIRGIPSCFHVNSFLWLISVNYSENNVRHINKYNQKRKSEPHEGRKVSKKFTGSKGIMVLKKRLEHMIQVRKKTSFAS